MSDHVCDKITITVTVTDLNPRVPPFPTRSPLVLSVQGFPFPPLSLPPLPLQLCWPDSPHLQAFRPSPPSKAWLFLQFTSPSPPLPRLKLCINFCTQPITTVNNPPTHTATSHCKYHKLARSSTYPHHRPICRIASISSFAIQLSRVLALYPHVQRLWYVALSLYLAIVHPPQTCCLTTCLYVLYTNQEHVLFFY